MRPKCSLLMGLIMGLLIFSSTGFAEVNEWSTKADMLASRFGLSASEVSGKIYAIGGRILNNSPRALSQTVEEYDPALDKWAKKADMTTGRYYLGTAAVNGKIYAIGGMPFDAWFSSAVEEYDPKKDDWEKKNNMIIARMSLRAATVKGRIYVIGGATDFRNENNNIVLISTSAVEEYDPVSNRWTEKADMPTPRYGFAIAVVKNKIYCMGGWNDDDILSTVEEYDPALDRWTKKADMLTQRGFLSASAVNNKIYAIGNRVGKSSATEEYDPVTDKWTKKADMITGRSDLSTSAVNGKIYAIGGVGGPNKIGLSTVEEYDTGFTSISVDAKGKLATSWGEIKIKRQ